MINVGNDGIHNDHKDNFFKDNIHNNHIGNNYGFFFFFFSLLETLEDDCLAQIPVPDDARIVLPQTYTSFYPSPSLSDKIT